MANNQVYQQIQGATSGQVAVLIDPDKLTGTALLHLVERAVNCQVDYFFVGGSLLLDNTFEKTIAFIKSHCSIPVVIFPGNNYQVSPTANALLFLSLLSGRNAEYLIGQQVTAAPLIKQAGIEVIPTAYLLIDGGRTSTTAYITQTMPIPGDKPDVVVATALAGQMLGMQMVYLEAGSGAHYPVSATIIQAVKKNVALPLIVGGGIRSGQQAEAAFAAGADVLVVGNVLEKAPEVLMEISLARQAKLDAVNKSE